MKFSLFLISMVIAVQRHHRHHHASHQHVSHHHVSPTQQIAMVASDGETIVSGKMLKREPRTRQSFSALEVHDDDVKTLQNHVSNTTKVSSNSTTTSSVPSTDKQNSTSSAGSESNTNQTTANKTATNESSGSESNNTIDNFVDSTASDLAVLVGEWKAMDARAIQFQKKAVDFDNQKRLAFEEMTRAQDQARILHQKEVDLLKQKALSEALNKIRYQEEKLANAETNELDTQKRKAGFGGQSAEDLEVALLTSPDAKDIINDGGVDKQAAAKAADDVKAAEEAKKDIAKLVKSNPSLEASSNHTPAPPPEHKTLEQLLPQGNSNLIQNTEFFPIVFVLTFIVCFAALAFQVSIKGPQDIEARRNPAERAHRLTTPRRDDPDYASYKIRSMHGIAIITSVYFLSAFLFSSLLRFITPLEAFRLANDNWQQTFIVVERTILAFSHIVAPIMGKMSDRTISQTGRRRPWLLGCIATQVVGSIFLFLASSITSLFLYELGFLLVTVGSTCLMVVGNGLVLDLIPFSETIIIAAFYVFHTGAGTLLGFIYEWVFSSIHLKWWYLFYALLVSVFGGVILTTGKEPAIAALPRSEPVDLPKKAYLKVYKEVLFASVDFFLVQWCRTLVYASSAILAFQIFYVRDMFWMKKREDAEHLVNQCSVVSQTGFLSSIAIAQPFLQTPNQQKYGLLGALACMMKVMISFTILPQGLKDQLGLQEIVAITLSGVHGGAMGVMCLTTFALMLTNLPNTMGHAESMSLFAPLQWVGFSMGSFVSSLLLFLFPYTSSAENIPVDKATTLSMKLHVPGYTSSTAAVWHKEFKEHGFVLAYMVSLLFLTLAWGHAYRIPQQDETPVPGAESRAASASESERETPREEGRGSGSSSDAAARRSILESGETGAPADRSKPGPGAEMFGDDSD